MTMYEYDGTIVQSRSRTIRQLSNPPTCIITEDSMKCWILLTVPQELTGRYMKNSC